MNMQHFRRAFLSTTTGFTTVSLTGVACLLAGCSDTSLATFTPVQVTGNWQMASAAPTANKLAAISGSLTGSSSAINGVLHADAASACVAPSVAVKVTGASDDKGNVTLTGPLAGGTLVIAGELAANGKSLSSASYRVNGGTCAMAVSAATAQTYASITGNYVGTFYDAPNSPVLSITSALTQTPESDSDGNFQLSGTATLPNNPCFNSPVSVAGSQVTGGSFTLTYADPVTTNSVTASGTFSTDGQTLTVTNWVSSGPCGVDSGTGLLTKQ
jgi:hypothetical protein